ncbi:hypothetical protein B0H13DRAFT_293336 [Mycena leptocephala]|nr:hypothetical protein B0H13DRAFT_293336 [Mycena leptocephala]
MRPGGAPPALVPALPAPALAANREPEGLRRVRLVLVFEVPYPYPVHNLALHRCVAHRPPLPRVGVVSFLSRSRTSSSGSTARRALMDASLVPGAVGGVVVLSVKVEAMLVPAEETSKAGSCRSNLTTGRAFFSCMSSCVGRMGRGPNPPAFPKPPNRLLPVPRQIQHHPHARAHLEAREEEQARGRGGEED